MQQLIKNEWKKVHLPAVAAVLLLTLLAVLLTSTLYHNYTLWYLLDTWEIGTEYFTLLFPLFAVIPLCWNLYYERKDNFILYVLPRVSQRKYLVVKWAVQAFCAFLILFIPYMLSAFWAYFVMEPILYVPNSFRHVFPEAYIQSPLLYAFLLSVWKGLVGVLVMTFGFVLSMYVNNLFLILTGPFIYSVLENFILAVLRLEKYRLVVSFEPTSISADHYTTGSLFAGPLLLILVTLFTAFFFSKIKKNSVAAV